MLKNLLESIADIENDVIVENDEEESTEITDAKIKMSVPFEQLLDLFFDEGDKRIGRIALRKIVRGDEANLTLRERSIISNAFVRVVKPIASDRTIYNRILRKLSEVE